MAKFALHMGDPHGGPQTSPQHTVPSGLGALLKKTIQEIHVDRCVVGWSAGRHVDHPCRGQISPWPARKDTEDRQSQLDTVWVFWGPALNVSQIWAD